MVPWVLALLAGAALPQPSPPAPAQYIARAWGTIFDANMTHIFSALIMFNIGSGPVKGFAWTLSMGVICSVFTAILVTQVLIGWWFRLARPKKLPI